MTDKEIDFKIGTKEEAYWTDLKKKFESEKEALDKQMIFTKATLEMIKEKIKNAN